MVKLMYKEVSPELAALVVLLVLSGKEFELTKKIPVVITHPVSDMKLPDINLTGPVNQRGVIPNTFKPFHKRR
jgi:hypothetical protein